MLSIRHGGNKLLLDGTPVDGCKISVLAVRESWLMIYPQDERPPMVERILHQQKNYDGWASTFPREFESLPMRTVASYLLWLPKYGRIATFHDDDALIQLNSRLGVYNGDTVGLRARKTAMTTVFVADFDDIHTPFEIEGLETPELRGLSQDAGAAWLRDQPHDYSILESAMRAFVKGKGKRLHPEGKFWV